MRPTVAKPGSEQKEIESRFVHAVREGKPQPRGELDGSYSSSLRLQVVRVSRELLAYHAHVSWTEKRDLDRRLVKISLTARDRRGSTTTNGSDE